jgi:hypothetical protein
MFSAQLGAAGIGLLIRMNDKGRRHLCRGDAMTPLLIAIVAAMFYGSIIWLLHRAHKRREQSDYECVNRQQEQSIRRHAQQWRWQ